MKILALDSCMNTSSVALLEDEKLISLYTVNTNNTHSETLLPMIKNMLATADVSVDEIDAYAVSYGPGSFTGVRIGVSTVKGLAFGRNKVCVEVSTIEALSANLEGFEGIICPVMNARRGQVYTGIFKGENRLMDDECMMLTDLAPILENYNEKIYFVGDGYSLVENKEIKLELRNISKHFGGVYANKNVNLNILQYEKEFCFQVNADDFIDLLAVCSCLL